jgi:hypothetical protein
MTAPTADVTSEPTARVANPNETLRWFRDVAIEIEDGFNLLPDVGAERLAIGRFAPRPKKSAYLQIIWVSWLIPEKRRPQPAHPEMWERGREQGWGFEFTEEARIALDTEKFLIADYRDDTIRDDDEHEIEALPAIPRTWHEQRDETKSVTNFEIARKYVLPIWRDKGEGEQELWGVIFAEWSETGLERGEQANFGVYRRLASELGSAMVKMEREINARRAAEQANRALEAQAQALAEQNQALVQSAEALTAESQRLKNQSAVGLTAGFGLLGAVLMLFALPAGIASALAVTVLFATAALVLLSLLKLSLDTNVVVINRVLLVSGIVFSITVALSVYLASLAQYANILGALPPR